MVASILKVAVLYDYYMPTCRTFGNGYILVAYEVEYGGLDSDGARISSTAWTRNSECFLESVRLKDSRLTVQIGIEGISHRITRVREDSEYPIPNWKRCTQRCWNKVIPDDYLNGSNYRAIVDLTDIRMDFMSFANMIEFSNVTDHRANYLSSTTVSNAIDCERFHGNDSVSPGNASSSTRRLFQFSYQC